jgi:hypothetical protein
MTVLLQVAALAVVVVLLLRWRSRRRRLNALAERFVSALLDGDYRRADLEATRFFAAAARRGVTSVPGTGTRRCTGPNGGATPGEGRAAA